MFRLSPSQTLGTFEKSGIWPIEVPVKISSTRMIGPGNPHNTTGLRQAMHYAIR